MRVRAGRRRRKTHTGTSGHTANRLKAGGKEGSGWVGGGGRQKVKTEERGERGNGKGRAKKRENKR